MPPSESRIPSLDGLRAVSILLVLLAHASTTQGYPRAGVFLGEYGLLGVKIFFVISGFLITTLLIREHERSQGISLRSFMRRRAYRLLPASLVFTTLTILATFSLGGHIAVSNMVAAYTFCVGYIRSCWQLGHLWSLGAEEQFYVLWPLCLVLAFRYRVLLAWVFFLVPPICRLWMFKHHSGDLNFCFPAVADNMAAGCLLAIYYPRLKRLPRWLWSTPVTLALIALALLIAPRLQYRNTLYWGLLPALITAALFCLVQRSDRVLNSKPIVYLGTLSYTLYLVQQPLLNGQAHTRLATFPLNLVLIPVLALALHYLVEKPVLRLSHRSSFAPGAKLRPRALDLASTNRTGAAAYFD